MGAIHSSTPITAIGLLRASLDPAKYVSDDDHIFKFLSYFLVVYVHFVSHKSHLTVMFDYEDSIHPEKNYTTLLLTTAE